MNFTFSDIQKAAKGEIINFVLDSEKFSVAGHWNKKTNKISNWATYPKIFKTKETKEKVGKFLKENYETPALVGMENA